MGHGEAEVVPPLNLPVRRLDSGGSDKFPHTSLQVSLAILVQAKQLVNQLHDYDVVCSYDELVRFRTSAAVWSANKQSYGVLSHYFNGLVQAVADNFDCNISSMNGLKQTHSLAIIILQSAAKPEIEREAIPRLKKTESNGAYLPDIETVQYIGHKKQQLHLSVCIKTVQPLRILAKTAAALKIATDCNLSFQKSITKDQNSPEYSGFNTKLACESGRVMQNAT